MVGRKRVAPVAAAPTPKVPRGRKPGSKAAVRKMDKGPVDTRPLELKAIDEKILVRMAMLADTMPPDYTSLDALLKLRHAFHYLSSFGV